MRNGNDQYGCAYKVSVCGHKSLPHQTGTYAVKDKALSDQITELNQSVGNHNDQLKQIYDTLENLPEEKADQKNWQNREPIGFRQAKK